MLYSIHPPNGWVQNKLNLEVGNAICDAVMPIVNSGRWDYEGIISYMDCIGTDCGCLSTEYFIPDGEEEEIEFIKSLEMSVTNPESELFDIMKTIAKRFDLVLSVKDGS